MSSSSAAASKTTVERIPIPPNLHLDPRSSYAARVVVPARASKKTAAATKRNGKGDDGIKALKETKLRAAQELGTEYDYESDEEDADGDFDDDDDDDDFMAVLEREVAFVTPLPDRLKATVQDVRDGSNVGTIWLHESVFGRDPIRVDLLKRAVDYHRAKKRGRRNAATKTISQVSGSGRKLRQQKGTGRARVGHGRPPHFRGGAKAHGPKNATHYGHTKLNKKVRKQALCHALSQKLKENNVILLNDWNVPSHKTSELSRILHQWNVGGDVGSSALLLDHYFPPQQDGKGATKKSSSGNKSATEESALSFRGVPANLHVASRNIPKVEVGNANKASVYELLRKEKLVLTLEALAVLERRLKDY
jgi:large subunit ribosomal protein L4